LRLAGLLEPAAEQPRGGLAALAELARALVHALGPALREAGVGLLIAALVFPPFVWGFSLWHAPARPFALALPDEPVGYLASQLVVIALPEEAFFRGYVQSRLAVAFAGRRRLLGVTLSPGALVLQALLFAVIHFAVDLDPQRLAVFFPGLLFGWLRAWRGGIGAAITLHALSNLLADVLARSWL
jgi:membrane protease YdiL (CAAX protease family)